LRSNKALHLTPPLLSPQHLREAVQAVSQVSFTVRLHHTGFFPGVSEEGEETS